MKNTSSTSHSDSPLGLATLVGIAGLANPRRVADSPKSIIIDSEIYIGSSEDDESIIGALRFYNGDDIDFTEETGLYLIYATFACMEDGINIQPVLSPWRYKFIGDLQWAIPLAPPIDAGNPEELSFPIDPCHRVYIHASGMATNCQKDAGTFTLDIEQYISVLKDTKNNTSKSIKPSTPISCIFPDSPRFRNGKPVPYNKHFVSISGFLTDVVYRNQSNHEGIDHFTVAVDHIAFLGQANSSSSSILPNTLDSSSKPNEPKKGLINYHPSRTNKKRTSPSTPLESEQPPNKRQRQVDSAKTKFLPSSSAVRSTGQRLVIYNVYNKIIDPPRITLEDIKDRSKGDAISKTLIILQTTWFIAQCIARWSSRLPVTELEVVTLAFAMLNLITYALWWHKPQNVGRPVFLEVRKPRVSSSVIPAQFTAADTSQLGGPRDINSAETNIDRKTESESLHPGHSASLWTRLCMLPFLCVAALLRPLAKLALDQAGSHTEEGDLRVGMFGSASDINKTVEAISATVAIGTLFGSVHLIPAFFLNFPSRQEMWLWRASAIAITMEPLCLGFTAYLLSLHAYYLSFLYYCTLGSIIFTLIGLPFYIVARMILLTLSIISLRSLPSAALQTIAWTSYIPHL